MAGIQIGEGIQLGSGLKVGSGLNIEANIDLSIITDGLILYLDAGNLASYPGTGNTWYDLSGIGNNANPGLLPAFQSSYGGIFNFNGGNYYFNLDSQIAIEAISIWIDMTNFTSLQYILGNQTNVGGIRYNGTTWLIYSGVAGYSQINWTKTDSMINFSARRKNTTTFQVFINGSYIGQGAHGGTGNSILCKCIGRRNATNPNYMNGQLSSLMIYNRPLTDTEILQNYNSTKNRYT